MTRSQFQLESATFTVPLAAAVPSFLTQTSTLNLSDATSVRTNASDTCNAGTTRTTADRKMPCGMLDDHPAASGTSFLPLEEWSASRPLTSTVNRWLTPGRAAPVTSNTEGVNEVVFVATAVPSTLRAAWWLTAPNSR